jgi:GNAT superfamily N-acetyltransferase
MPQELMSVGNVIDASLVAELERCLTEHALESGTAPPAKQPLTVALHDHQGTLIGGLIGDTMWGWLFVKFLWVKKDRRGFGHGAALLGRAEREAANRGCHGVYLDTFDFQARGFYEKLGYATFGCLEEFPRGHSRYFLAKALK